MKKNPTELFDSTAMPICDMGPERACRRCGSSVMGRLCECGQIMCACAPCPICKANYEAQEEEERERGRFEAEREAWLDRGREEGYF